MTVIYSCLRVLNIVVSRGQREPDPNGCRSADNLFRLTPLQLGLGSCLIGAGLLSRYMAG